MSGRKGSWDPFACEKCGKRETWPSREAFREAYEKNKRPSYFCSCLGVFEESRQEWLEWVKEARAYHKKLEAKKTKRKKTRIR